MQVWEWNNIYSLEDEQITIIAYLEFEILWSNIFFF